MFELTDKEKEYISIEKVFDNEIPNYLDSSLYNYGNYSGYLYTENTRASEPEVVKRPDALITLRLFKEITGKETTIGYAGLNFENSIAYNYNNYLNQNEYTEEMKINLIKSCFIKGNHITTGVFSDRVGIKFFNVIKGSSLITKLKENFKEQFTFDTRDGNVIHSITRLKDLEMNLIENRYDNVFAFLYTQEDNYDGETRSVICVVVNKYSWFKYRKTLSLIPEIVPDIIPNNDDQYQNDILELLKAFGEKGPDNTKWKEKLKDILGNPERIKEKIQNQIQQLIANTKDKKIKIVKKQVEIINNNIENAYKRLQEYYNEKRVKEGELLVTDKDPETEQMIKDCLDYIEKCNFIEKYEIKPENNTIRFIVNAPIKYFDPEYAKKIYSNLSNIINGTNVPQNKITKAAFIELFENLFIKDKYTLYCTSILDIYLYPDNSSHPLAYEVRSFRYSNEDKYKYLGQPHLANYSCLGDNRIEMSKACELGDMLGILTVFTTSAQNFNLTDSAVLRTFIDDITYHNSDKVTIKDNSTGEFISFDNLKQNIENETNKKYKELSTEQINYLRKALYAYNKLYVPEEVALAILKTVEDGVTVTKSGHEYEANRTTVLTTNTQNNTRTINMHILNLDYYTVAESHENDESFTKYDFTRFLNEYEQTAEENITTEVTPVYTVTTTDPTTNEVTTYTRYEPTPTEVTTQPRMPF